jgi:GNAT superfamily N-acetyltransferase
MDATNAPQPVQLGPADHAAALALSDEAGWNQNAADWNCFLTNGLVFGLHDPRGGVVATAALMPYPPIAWISMVLVTPTWRRRKFASVLLTHCIEAARSRDLDMWLDATPAGAAVYEQIGFNAAADDFQRLRRQGTDGSRTPPAPIDRALLRQLIEHDRLAMAADRSALLTGFAERPGSRLYARGGAVCLLRDGRRARHIGPLFAGDDHQAKALLDEVLRAETGPLIVDLRDGHAVVADALGERGFAVERPFRRMHHGTPRHRSVGAPVAITGPEFG